MRLTSGMLRQIIKEEMRRVLSEAPVGAYEIVGVEGSSMGATITIEIEHSGHMSTIQLDDDAADKGPKMFYERVADAINVSAGESTPEDVEPASGSDFPNDYGLYEEFVQYVRDNV